MIAITLVALFLAPGQTSAQGPLPSVEDFKADIQPIIETFLNASQAAQDKTSPPDGGELKQYTYMETATRTKLNSKGQPQGTETILYQITRGTQYWEFYRKRISTNGVAVSKEELEKQDREQKKREDRQKEEAAR